MKSIIICAIILASTSSYAVGDCLNNELLKIDNKVSSFELEMKERYGEDAVEKADLDTYRSDLQIIARMNARTCLQIEERVLRK